jgi:hypothetical protein
VAGGQSAKRYGVPIDDNLDLELRLRRIEVELGKRAFANEDATTLSRGRGDVPRVAGLRVGGQIPGGLTVNWNAVTISDLRRYEIEFATDLAFTKNKQAFTAGGITYPFTTALGGGLVYYARVRAVNSTGRRGTWSITLNTSTGQADSGDIADGAVDATNIAGDSITNFHIADATILADNIAGGTITADEIAADTITDAEIAANAITNSELAADAVANANMQNNSVDTAELVSGAVTTTEIANGTVAKADANDSDLGSKLTLSGYINGLVLSNNGSTPDEDVDIAVGVARDSTNVVSMVSTSVITKGIDGEWEDGSGSGGLVNGDTLQADTPYFVFLLSDATGTSVDACFDESPTGAGLSADTDISGAGYTLFRRIGCVVTDGTSDIRKFHQYGDFFQYDEPAQDPATLTNPGTSEITHTLTLVPVGIEHRVNMTIAYRPTNGTAWPGYTAFASGYMAATLTASASNTDGGTISTDDRTVEHLTDILVPTAATFKTHTTASHAQLVINIQIHGWVDLRGKDGSV